MHQAQIAIGLNVTSQNQAAIGFVNAQDGSNQTHGRQILPQHFKREQQTRARQVFGIVAQVAFVDIQGRLAIEFVQHVVVAAGDAADDPKGLPAMKTAMAHLDVIAYKANSHQLRGRHGLI